jgi:hypothetical protein
MNRKDQDTGSTTLDLSLGDERNTTPPKEKQCRNANLEKATWKYRRSDSAAVHCVSMTGKPSRGLCRVGRFGADDARIRDTCWLWRDWRVFEDGV